MDSNSDRMTYMVHIKPHSTVMDDVGENSLVAYHYLYSNLTSGNDVTFNLHSPEIILSDHDQKRRHRMSSSGTDTDVSTKQVVGGPVMGQLHGIKTTMSAIEITLFETSLGLSSLSLARIPDSKAWIPNSKFESLDSRFESLEKLIWEDLQNRRHMQTGSGCRSQVSAGLVGTILVLLSLLLLEV